MMSTSTSTLTPASNPSHLLINRNPPLPAHPQLFSQSTSRHSAASHSVPTFPSASAGAYDTGTGTGLVVVPARQSLDQGYTGVQDDHGYEYEDSEDEVEVHSTFSRDSQLRGKVKVIVGRNEFWCHKEILWFASPFFQGLLAGNWAENTRHYSPALTASASRRSSSPTDTNHDPDLFPSHLDTAEADADADAVLDNDRDTNSIDLDTDDSTPQRDVQSRKGSIYLDAVSDPLSGETSGLNEILRELREIPTTNTRPPGPSYHPPEAVPQVPHTNRSVPLFLDSNDTGAIIPGPGRPLSTAQSHTPPFRSNRSRTLRHSFSSSTVPSRTIEPLTAPGPSQVELDPQAEATVELHEESAAAFQDFLFWAYPHLECKVTWTNVEPLVALSTKLLVPALQSICYGFLLTYASGKPIVALSLAEEYGHADLYREASRFVLDQAVWNEEEMEELSTETKLKLSQRRNWFLERLLKLGSIDVKKEYQCRSDCPDPARCQALIDDKWRQAHLAVCRYGPPQPSFTFRCLRQLETLPTNPSLVMPHPLCQMSAKTWVKNLFDRMFGFRLINSPQNPGTEKYWLAITLN